ncbi:hypothetical protein NL676_031976 [Syzygium grande]|nr:hypothetical protein NL676_031976 [Syzygium grande]
MGLEGKVEEEFEINSPADKFYKCLSSELHHLPDASPAKVQGAEILDGDWVTSGSVKLWNYTIGTYEPNMLSIHLRGYVQIGSR